MAFPAWLASIVQVPGATIVTVLPVSVQAAVVVLLKATGRPELAVADTVNGGSPKALFASAAKVIVWLALPTVKLRGTCGAGL